MTIANCITMTRLLLSPVFVYFFVIGDKHAALVVFCIAGGTDLIDGMFARLLKQQSSYGAILDPMADKVLIESAFVCLVVAGVLPLWFLILAFLRDLMITAGIIYFKVRKIKLPYRAIWSSKFATLAMLLTIITALFSWWQNDLTLVGIPLQRLLMIFMYIAAVLIVISGVLYVRLGFSMLRRCREKG